MCSLDKIIQDRTVLNQITYLQLKTWKTQRKIRTKYLVGVKF